MRTDFLIIGSGIAGLSLAIRLSKFGKVIIITKKRKAESNTNYAQGGIASVLGSDDNFEFHIKDTMECGGGLCSYDAVKKIVTDGPNIIYDLLEQGVRFTKDSRGKLKLGKEGGHSRNRIVHAKDLTGKEIERALLYGISKNKNIKIYEYFFSIDLLTNKNIQSKIKKKDKSCYGIYALNVKSNRVEKIILDESIAEFFIHLFEKFRPLNWI